MAEVQEKDKGEKKKGKQKKMRIHVDFTPMVDMNMLLICFFMLATTMSIPQTMEISMPTNDKVSEEEQTQIKESRAITVLLCANDELYYYIGQPDYDNISSLKKTNYTASGLRAFLIGRNKNVVEKLTELKQKKLHLEITEEEYREQSEEIKKDSNSPIVIIKPSERSNYKNLIDALDEMHICGISKYAIVDITDDDESFIENAKTANLEKL